MKLNTLDLKRVKSVVSRVIGGETVRLRGGHVVVYGYRDGQADYIGCRRINAPKNAKPDIFCWDIPLISALDSNLNNVIAYHHAFRCWKVIETILSGKLGWLPARPRAR